MYVAIYKFTKWTQVDPMRKVTAQSTMKFLKGLVCPFGVPTRIITNNSTQFTSHAFMKYVQAIGSKVSFCSVTHPRSSRKAERENVQVLGGLKRRTFDRLQKCGR